MHRTISNAEATNRWTAVPDNLPLLLNANECAALLGVTPKHIRYLLTTGQLKGCKLGGTWRVNRDALLTLAGLA